MGDAEVTLRELVAVLESRLEAYEEREPDARLVAEWAATVALDGTDVRAAARRYLTGVAAHRSRELSAQRSRCAVAELTPPQKLRVIADEMEAAHAAGRDARNYERIEDWYERLKDIANAMLETAIKRRRRRGTKPTSLPECLSRAAKALKEP